MNKIITLDSVWEKNYRQGHVQRYPWDSVVSFVFHHAPKNKPRDQIKILEVGFGTGSNLWFAAREGFQVFGIEGSESAVKYATQRFSEDHLTGDLRIGDFTSLPFEDNQFDLVIDRGALTCVGTAALKKALSEIHRTLTPKGKLLFNPYADSHSGFFSGRTGVDDVTVDIDMGKLADVGQLRFTSRREINGFLASGWTIRSVERKEVVDMNQKNQKIHAEWLVVAEKNHSITA